MRGPDGVGQGERSCPRWNWQEKPEASQEELVFRIPGLGRKPQHEQDEAPFGAVSVFLSGKVDVGAPHVTWRLFLHV